ncbi:hypothetical protein PPYR_04289 [Photinus pyralis]|uniref:Uncharacterized protein n=1 Tax=Photinus pyralis TaxID=7054 RepID=A0A5N4AXU1_PHOPY|nr:neuronal growth regulator 1-like [Photinus pyralis]KAB0802103.1 hypothetical protein PPYR_04289 [Photinus pyralis]
MINAFQILILFGVKCACQVEFKSAPTTVKAPENDTVLLPCYLETITNDGSIYNRIKWYKNGELLTDSGPPSMLPPSKMSLAANGSLLVTDVQHEDTGEYMCEIIRPDPWSTIRQRHAIEVLEPPTVVPDPANGFLQVRLREEVRMSCKVHGVPYPLITWLYENKDMQLIDNREMLKFAATDRQLSGNYQCMARNGVGEPAVATITLNIIYPPELMTMRSWMHTAPGIRTQLECIVYADPPATVTWLKGEIPVPFSNRIVAMVDGDKHILLIRNATFADFGIYTCRATNDLGQGELQIQLSGTANPAVFKQADQKMVDTKTSYRLVWEADSYPSIIEYKLWFRRYRPHNDIRNSDWNILTIPSETSTGPVHAKSYTIQGLRERTVYEAMVTSRNRYGWSKKSAVLKFATDGADFKEEVITPIQIQGFDEVVSSTESSNGVRITLSYCSQIFMCLFIYLIK